jgi:hypothetical protein
VSRKRWLYVTPTQWLKKTPTGTNPSTSDRLTSIGTGEGSGLTSINTEIALLTRFANPAISPARQSRQTRRFRGFASLSVKSAV